MQPPKQALSSTEPGWSENFHSHPEFDPGEITKRFALKLKCNVVECGEIVHATGTSSVEAVREDNGDWDEIERLFPEALVPAPPIIAMPDETPPQVRRQIKSSFALFWVDAASCANRLRTSVEGVLDNFQIPKQGTSKKGSPYDLNLAQRIE